PRHLGDVEFAPAQKAPVPRRGRHVGEHRELDAFRADDALLEGAHDLVVAASEGQLELSGHLGPCILAGLAADCEWCVANSTHSIRHTLSATRDRAIHDARLTWSAGSPRNACWRACAPAPAALGRADSPDRWAARACPPSRRPTGRRACDG